jgi:hypothetical protein
LDIKGESVTLDAALKLSPLLAELDHVTDAWEGLANQAPVKALYRGYIWRMDQHLQKHYRVTKELRADLIAAAIKWMGAESRVSQSSIQKSLTREADEPRRFTFDGGPLPENRKTGSGHRKQAKTP